jgi:hypothetical protein
MKNIIECRLSKPTTSISFWEKEWKIFKKYKDKKEMEKEFKELEKKLLDYEWRMI